MNKNNPLLNMLLYVKRIIEPQGVMTQKGAGWRLANTQKHPKRYPIIPKNRLKHLKKTQKQPKNSLFAYFLLYCLLSYLYPSLYYCHPYPIASLKAYSALLIVVCNSNLRLILYVPFSFPILNLILNCSIL